MLISKRLLMVELLVEALIIEVQVGTSLSLSRSGLHFFSKNCSRRRKCMYRYYVSINS